jgi:hypothetical protein
MVTTGSYCTAQGIVKQVGDLGVALITLVGPLLCRRLAPMMHLYPDPCYPHIRNRTVASGYRSTWGRFWNGWPRVCFHWALGWPR